MALAGDDEIIVPVEPELAGLARHMGGQRGESAGLGGLGFLAAKGAAHAPRLHGDEGVGHGEHPRHHALHHCGVLGGGMDEHLASLARHGEGGLSLEIEMLLPADAQLSRELVGRLRDGLRRVAHPEIVIGQNLRIRRQRILDGEDGRLLLDLHMGQSGGATRLIAGPGDDHEDHLPPEDHGAIGDQGIVVEGVGGGVVARHIRSRQHGDHARGRAHRR